MVVSKTVGAIVGVQSVGIAAGGVYVDSVFVVVWTITGVGVACTDDVVSTFGTCVVFVCGVGVYLGEVVVVLGQRPSGSGRPRRQKVAEMGVEDAKSVRVSVENRIIRNSVYRDCKERI